MPSFRPPAVARAIQRLLLVLGLATLAGVLIAGLLLPFIGSVGLAARTAGQTFRDLPVELQAKPLAQRSVVLDSEGRLLATFYDQFRIYRTLAEIPKVMQQALIATEDARFYDHGPIDLYGAGRALVRNVQSGNGPLSGQGASTLTQQYVKMLLVDQAQTAADVRAATAPTPARKLRELRLAIAAEQRYTKDQILERYLNIAFFGGGAYGVEAAARHYFNTTVSKLTLPQAALLAGLVQSPSHYDPGHNPDAAQGRRNEVLKRMETVGYITPATAARTRALGLDLNIRQVTNGCITSYAPFFCDYVVHEIRTLPSLGPTPDARERTLKRGGLIIKTTLDLKTQKAAAKAIQQYVYPTDSVAAAIAVVEPGTGKIKAMTQSRGYGNGRGRTYVNYAVDQDHGTSLGIQPGSTFKAFVLAAAIDKGIPLSYKINAPLQIDMSGRRFQTCTGSTYARNYRPRSSTGSGVLDLRTGTAYSNNTFYIQLERMTGLCRPATIAEKLGVTLATGKPLEQVPSFTLGSNPVSPLAMAEAYAAFAAHGVHCNSIAITSIRSRSGQVFDVPDGDCKQAISVHVADTVTSVLAGVIDGPWPGRTGRLESLGRDAAGKTGTTDNTRAVWFVGYVPQLAAAVGVFDPRGPQAGALYGRSIGGVVRGFDAVSGGKLPGPIWKAAMQGALAGVPAIPFQRAQSYQGNGQYGPQQGPVGVPYVAGQQRFGAIGALTSAGYRWRVVRVRSPLSRGTVVGSIPPAGAQLPPGAPVQILVSTGRP